MTNTTTIKKWEPLLKLWYKNVDGNFDFILVPKKYKNKLLEALNSKKYVELEGIILKTDLIYKVEDFRVETSLDEFIANLPPQARKILEERNKEKYLKVGRYIETIEEAKKYLEKKGFKL